tara:strand:+ start:305 stop:505 length:201 start_codon:yes stop_codon:yes gene_type:complete
MARTMDEFGNESGSIVERKERKKRELAMNQGPSTPIKYYDNMGYMPDLGAGRVKNVRMKKPPKGTA